MPNVAHPLLQPQLMHKILGPIFFLVSISALNSSNEKNDLKYENPKPYICNTQKSSFSGHFCTEKWLMGKLKKQIKRDFFRSIRQRRQGKAGVYLLSKKTSRKNNHKIQVFCVYRYAFMCLKSKVWNFSKQSQILQKYIPTILYVEIII